MPSTTQLYRQLLLTPLFQGMNRADMEEVVASTKFGFSRFEPESTIVADGDACRQLHFLLQGQMTATTSASDHSYSVSETIPAPFLLQPERLFGLNQRHTITFTALNTCNFMTLGKEEILRLCDQYLIFRLNLLNLLAARVHKLDEAVWYSRRQTLEEKILHFFLRHSLRPAGEKTVKIKMERLGEILGTSRLFISRELNAMQQSGLVSLSRGKIHIPALERLFIK